MEPDPALSFRVSQLRDEGLSRRRIDRSLARPYWGIRSEVETFDPVVRARQLRPRLPADAFFSHVTAAQIWGLPLPRRVVQDVRPHVSMPTPLRGMDTADVISHAVRIDASSDVVRVDGMRVSSVARLWIEMSSLLGLADLVALGDSILHRGLAREDELTRRAARPRFRGRLTARAALSLLDERAESPMESLLRVALVSAGLSPILVNQPLIDSRGGFVARPDLRLADRPVVIEYDGDGHRSDPDQWRKDVARYGAIEDLGFVVVRATAADLPAFTRVIERVRRLARRPLN